jgi:hypothetical protein
MTTIRTTCPRCGEVDMGPEAILLSIRDQLVGEGSYRFACPECQNTIEKPADRKVVQLLLSAGVEIEDLADLESSESGDEVEPDDRPEFPELHLGGPPLSWDDLLAFHLLLADDDEVDRALRELR